MADRGDRFAFVRELLRQRDRILIDADTIHIAGAAWHHQQVVVGSLHVGQARVRGQRFTFVASCCTVSHGSKVVAASVTLAPAALRSRSGRVSSDSHIPETGAAHVTGGR